MTTKRRRSTRVEVGSGNVFADLGLKDADQLMARSQIGFHVFKILEEQKLKQREIAGVLGIAQSDVSHLMNGHFSRFTTAQTARLSKTPLSKSHDRSESSP